MTRCIQPLCCTVHGRQSSVHVDGNWSDGLRDDRKSNHGTVLFAVRHLCTFIPTRFFWKIQNAFYGKGVRYWLPRLYGRELLSTQRRHSCLWILQGGALVWKVALSVVRGTPLKRDTKPVYCCPIRAISHNCTWKCQLLQCRFHSHFNLLNKARANIFSLRFHKMLDFQETVFKRISVKCRKLISSLKSVDVNFSWAFRRRNTLWLFKLPAKIISGSEEESSQF